MTDYSEVCPPTGSQRPLSGASKAIGQTAKRLVLPFPVEGSPCQQLFSTRATGRRKSLLNSFTRQPSWLQSTPSDMVVIYSGLSKAHVITKGQLGRCYKQPSVHWRSVLSL